MIDQGTYKENIKMRYLVLMIAFSLVSTSCLWAQVSGGFEHTFVNDSACVTVETGPLIALHALSNSAVAWEWQTDHPRTVMLSSTVARNPNLSIDFTKGDIPEEVEVTLRATDDGGSVTTTTKLISLHLHYAPMVKFSPGYEIKGCEPLDVDFVAMPFMVNDAVIVNYSWTFGDGESASSESPSVSHQYAEAGEYVVKLEMTDDTGCKGSNMPFLKTTRVIVQSASLCK